MKIFITGGTTGIGLELARLYTIPGNKIGLCGRNLSKITDPDPSWQTYQVDVTNREQLQQAINHFVGDEHLDLIIANAGISMGAKSVEPDFQLARQVININLLGVLNSFELALKLMRPGGHLVAIASVAGLMGLPGAGPYCASKAAVLKLCESLALDLKHKGITVSAIAPGFIDTPLTRKNNHPMPFLMPASKGARLIKKAIDKKKVLYIFPWQMKIAVLILEKIPRFLYRALMKLGAINYSSKHRQ